MNRPKPDPYPQLARYLNTLPAGFPPTESGIEIDLLKQLFTEKEAALALHLSLINAPPEAIARRAGHPVDSVAALLIGMAEKGLIAVHFEAGGTPDYAISQFVIGFWEGQVNRLDEEAVRLFEAYGPIWFKQGPWKRFPQVRTIPIQQTIPVTTEVMAYQKTEAILRSKTLIAVQNCVCRQEGALLGHDCGAPLETCLSFDNAAQSSISLGRGREISLEEALAILEKAQEAGLVLQPANSQNPIFMCACCDCCCGVLRQIKQEPNPGDLVMNAFIASFDPTLCIACGACVEICPMAALVETSQGPVDFDPNRCIGCGLCTSRCPSSALTMVVKPGQDQPRIPKNTTWTYLNLARRRGGQNLLANLWHILKKQLAGIIKS
jgi:ferredoxin